MRAEIEYINPAYAKQLLEQNCKNRKLSQKTVDRYASDMKEGRWESNGQGIILTAEGKLLDGQHRMAAVVQAQCNVGMLVVRGVPEAAFHTMDSGRARTLSDVLSVRGFANTALLGAVARTSWTYASGAIVGYTPTKAALERFILDHDYLSDITATVNNRLRMPSKSAIAAVLFLANEGRKFDTEVEKFVEALSTGAALYKGDPRLTLREWLMATKGKTSSGGTHARVFFTAVARAWNAYAEGRELSIIRQVDAVNRQFLPIYGYDQTRYQDVPDVLAEHAEISRANLMRSRSNLPAAEATLPRQQAAA